MDGREWMGCHRLSVEYRHGVEAFLTFARDNLVDHQAILCPCIIVQIEDCFQLM